MCYYKKETALRFASFEADTEAVTWFSREWRFGHHRSHAFGKTNQAPIQCFDVKCLVFFLYKLRSLGVEHHITTIYAILNKCFAVIYLILKLKAAGMSNAI